MLVAIMTRIRYSSVSSACSVPIPPPPPPFIIPPIIWRLRLVSGSSASADSIAFLASRHWVSFDRYENPWQPAWAKAGSAERCCPPGAPWVIMPRLPSESASSKKTITPP